LSDLGYLGSTLVHLGST